MNDAPGVSAGTGEQPSPAPAPPQTDDIRAELERLRAEAAQQRSVLAALEPFAEDIGRFVSDEGYRNYVRAGKQYYDDLSQRKPQDLDPSLVAVRDEIRDQIKPLREVVDTFTAREKAQRDERVARTFTEGKAIVEPFLQAHPELRSSRAFAATLDAMQQDAVERDVPFKEVWDNYASGFAPQPRERKTPPPSLRANDGDQGIPAAPATRPTTQNAEGKPLSMREAFLQTHARLNGKAS